MDYFNNNNNSSAVPSSQGSDYLSSSTSSTQDKSSMNWLTIILILFLLFIAYLAYKFYNTILINGHLNDSASQKLSLFGKFLYDFFVKGPDEDSSDSKDASGNSTSNKKQQGKIDASGNATGNSRSNQKQQGKIDASGNTTGNSRSNQKQQGKIDASGNASGNASPPYPNTNTSSIKQPGTSVGQQNANQGLNNPLNDALQYNDRDQVNDNKYREKRQQELYNLPQAQDYCADEACSSIQKTKPLSKAGWCFIGTDRGFRSCVEVGEQDKCMSGEIFPSQDICVNPRLR